MRRSLRDGHPADRGLVRKSARVVEVVRRLRTLPNEMASITGNNETAGDLGKMLSR